MQFLKKFIDWLFNNDREEVNTPKTTWHKIPLIYFKATPEAREVIDNWLEVNEIPVNTFGKVLHEIGILSTDIYPDGLFGSTTISFEKEIVPINNRMRTEDFVGCLKFNTNGGLIPSDNKNGELLNYLLENKDKKEYECEKHYPIHYYIYLYDWLPKRKLYLSQIH